VLNRVDQVFTSIPATSWHGSAKFSQTSTLDRGEVEINGDAIYREGAEDPSFYYLLAQQFLFLGGSMIKAKVFFAKGIIPVTEKSDKSNFTSASAYLRVIIRR